MKKFKRYLSIYKTLIKLNVVSTFTYRANFYGSMLASAGWSTYIIASMVLLTSKTTSVFGWSREELLVTAGLYNVIYSIFYVLFSRNFKMFADTIHYGKLDGILMKPIDSQFLMTCQYIIFGNIIRFSLGFLFLVYMIFHLNIEITLVTVLGFLALMVFSIMIIYSFWMLIMTLIIWFTNLVNLVDLLYDVNHITRFPQEMYRGVSFVLLIVVFPLTLVIMTPAKYLLHNLHPGDILVFLGFAVGMFTLTRLFWKFALRYYTSASG